MSDRSPSVVTPGVASDGITARAAVLESFQKPLTVRQFPVPAPGPGEILVDVRYGGICGTDLHLQLGHLPIPVPLVLGHEGLGSIRRLGTEGLTDANGTELRIGDTVMWASSIACGSCGPCRQHREPTLCESRGHTESIGKSKATPVCSALGPKPFFSIQARQWCGFRSLWIPWLPCLWPAPATLIHALYERRPVRVGETVIVQGSGPVGMAAAALAQLSGAAMVILLGGPQQRLDLARQCGIGDVHLNIADRSDTTSALNEAREMTRGGLGADLVIECAGVPEAVAQGIDLARRGGSYLVVGQYTDSGETLFNPHQLVYRQLEVVGSWAFTGAHLVHYVNLLPSLLQRFDLRRLVTGSLLVR